MSGPDAAGSEPPGQRLARRFERAFTLALARLKLPAGPWVAAVSGGCDSMALAHLLCRFHRGPLIIAHFDHELRGEESREDARFVQRWYQTHLPLRPTDLVWEMGKPPTPLLSASGNLEANARKARYLWLNEVANRHQASCLLTAHHADDQAETLLFRLMRGTGIRGMAGIAPKKSLRSGLVLARPLLELPKARIIDYMRQQGQAWREDSSNDSPHLARNRIRHQVLPLLREVMGDHTIQAVASFAWHAHHLERASARAFARWQERHVRSASPEVIEIALDGLRRGKPYWAAHHLACCFRAYDWPCLAMSREHWLRLVEQARNGPIRLHLPGGILAHRLGKAGLLRLSRPAAVV